MSLGRRIGFTIGALLVFRLGTFISIPGIDAEAWQGVFYQHSGAIGPFDWLAGGAIGRMSILALGLVPFVSASVLLQLASIMVPALRALPRRGESGRRRLDVYTLALTVIIAIFQSLGIAIALEGTGTVVVAPRMIFFLTTALTLTGGVIFLVWLASQITARGIGNGVSLILAVGIVAELPAALAGMLELVRQGMPADYILGICVFALGLTTLIVHMELARQQLAVTFHRQADARTIEGRSQLQLKLNNAGIIPTILASWLLILPFLAASLGLGVPGWILEHLKQGTPVFLVVYALAIFVCVFFYTAFLLNPDEVAEDLNKYGGVIAGVAPGEATADHIDRVISRTSAIGAVYLAFVYLIPEILIAKWAVPFYLGGTSFLILVCAILDVMAQLKLDRAALERGREAG